MKSAFEFIWKAALLSLILPLMGAILLAIHPLYLIIFVFSGPKIIIVIYSLGLVPSIVTSCAFLLMRTRLHPGIVTALTAIISGASAVIWFTVLQGSNSKDFQDGFWKFSAGLAAIASLFVTLTDWMRRNATSRIKRHHTS